MPPASKITYTVKGKLSSTASGTLSNTVTVTAPQGVNDPNTANNSATDSDTIAFKAIIRDSFPSTVTGVTYTATQGGGASGFTASGSGNISNTVNMPLASKITYKATGRISASATGSIPDTATVTPPTGVTDPDIANAPQTRTPCNFQF